MNVPFLQAIQNIPPWITTILLLWSLFWKGLALWRAASSKQKAWYVAILLINSLGILEIVYLFKFATHPLSLNEIKGWFAT